MSQETILVTGAAGSVGSTAHTAIPILLGNKRRRPDAVCCIRERFGDALLGQDKRHITTSLSPSAQSGG